MEKSISGLAGGLVISLSAGACWRCAMILDRIVQAERKLAPSKQVPL